MKDDVPAYEDTLITTNEYDKFRYHSKVVLMRLHVLAKAQSMNTVLLLDLILSSWIQLDLANNGFNLSQYF